MSSSYTVEDASSYEWVYGFQGGREDTITSDTQFGERDLNSGTGTWTSMDPTLFGGGDVDLDRFVGNDPLMFNDPDGLTKIEVRYRPLDGFLGAFGVHHAFIIVTDNNGRVWRYSAFAANGDGNASSASGSSASSTSSSGGSSSGSVSGASGSTSLNSSNSISPGSSPAKPGGTTGPWGQLTTVAGPYAQNTYDWTTDVLPNVIVVDDPKLPSQPILDKLNSMATNVQNNTIPYNPTGPNSNSFAHQLVEDLGYTRPTPPVLAPGWKVKIPTEDKGKAGQGQPMGAFADFLRQPPVGRLDTVQIPPPPKK